jgi:GNAT superfamily N-acetyltransferase
MNDRKDAALLGGPAGPDRERADKDSFTYHHASYEEGQHWFSAEHDGDEVGHAHVIERQGPGSPHAEIRQLWTDPHYRSRGIGSRLLEDVAGHFNGRELRLKPYPAGEDGDPGEGVLREYYSNRGFGDYQLKDGDPSELYDYMTKPGSRRQRGKAQAPDERGALRSPAASPHYLHGGPNRVEPGSFIHQDAMPQSHGRLRHNYFTTSREVAEDAADMRDGLGHGWIHEVEPAGDFEVDRGEPDSWKSEAPLRVVSVEPGQLNGKTPHGAILRQQSASAGSSAALGHLYRATPYPGGFLHDEWTHASTTAAAENRIATTDPPDYGPLAGTPAAADRERPRNEACAAAARRLARASFPVQPAGLGYMPACAARQPLRQQTPRRARGR